MHESRVLLTPASPQAVRALLDRTTAGDPAALGHKLLWTLFADHPDRRRDFLWRLESERPFGAIVRSARPPVDGIGGLWTILRSYPFAPRLEAGRMLRFRLRCVPVTWVRHGPGEPTRRQDVIMAAWMRLPARLGSTPEELDAAAHEAALLWLLRQGDRCGFRPIAESLAIRDYDRHRLPRGRAEPVTFGAVTFEGRLLVIDPSAFAVTLAEGLGAARAFGHGLIQIAPADGDASPDAGEGGEDHDERS